MFTGNCERNEQEVLFTQHSISPNDYVLYNNSAYQASFPGSSAKELACKAGGPV